MEGPSQLKLQSTSSQFIVLSKSHEVEWWFALSYSVRLVAYILILVLLVIVIGLIIKYLEECDYNNNIRPVEDHTSASETHALWPAKAVPVSYGTYEEDLESGKGGSSSELYDGKICVICYDEQRNCFFVPCGHCATCYLCAQRILDGENKTCPVCRRFIGKVRKLCTL